MKGKKGHLDFFVVVVVFFFCLFFERGQGKLESLRNLVKTYVRKKLWNLKINSNSQSVENYCL